MLQRTILNEWISLVFRGQLAGLSGAGIAKGRRASHTTKDQQLAAG